MTRQECERRLTELMEQAYALFKEFNHDGGHLSMFATNDGCCVMGYVLNNGERVRIINGFRIGKEMV